MRPGSQKLVKCPIWPMCLLGALCLSIFGCPSEDGRLTTYECAQFCAPMVIQQETNAKRRCVELMQANCVCGEEE